MGTKISLTVPDDVYAQFQSVAESSQRDVTDLVLETLVHNAPRFPVDSKRAQMEQEVEAFNVLHPQLISKYLGVYVAIHNKQLVDHDHDPVALLKRVKANFPQQVVLRRKVTKTAEPVIHVRRPKIILDE